MRGPVAQASLRRDRSTISCSSCPARPGSVDDLVAGTERGLLLNCLWYIREVDPTTLLLTGLTRDGVYLVEEGEVTAAVNNFRFNESPVDLLARATEAGASVRTLGREAGEYLNRTRRRRWDPRLQHELGEPSQLSVWLRTGPTTGTRTVFSPSTPRHDRSVPCDIGRLVA